MHACGPGALPRSAGCRSLEPGSPGCLGGVLSRTAGTPPAPPLLEVLQGGIIRVPPKGSAAVSETGELGAGCFGGLWNTRVCLKSQRAPPPGFREPGMGESGDELHSVEGERGLNKTILGGSGTRPSWSSEWAVSERRSATWVSDVNLSSSRGGTREQCGLQVFELGPVWEDSGAPGCGQVSAWPGSRARCPLCAHSAQVSGVVLEGFHPSWPRFLHRSHKDAHLSPRPFPDLRIRVRPGSVPACLLPLRLCLRL